MEAGKVVLKGKTVAVDLVDAMVAAADDAVSDEDVQTIERSACPTCGSCSGMFTANSMNCLTEALGLSLPGNGSTLATHSDRERLFLEAGHTIVDLARRYYEQDDATALPRTIASFGAFENAMCLDIAMAAPPTPCCTSWPPPTRRGWTSPWPTSTAFPAPCPASAKSPPPRPTCIWRTCTAPAA